jgi:hypothetical protein
MEKWMRGKTDMGRGQKVVMSLNARDRCGGGEGHGILETWIDGNSMFQLLLWGKCIEDYKSASTNPSIWSLHYHRHGSVIEY